VSSGERKRMRLNRVRVIPGRGCGCGVVGFDRRGSAELRTSCMQVSGRRLESVTVVGESPVRESLCGGVGRAPE
jgi:hypothetical protein